MHFKKSKNQKIIKKFGYAYEHSMSIHQNFGEKEHFCGLCKNDKKLLHK
jgi:hypothetical protein